MLRFKDNRFDFGVLHMGSFSLSLSTTSRFDINQ